MESAKPESDWYVRAASRQAPRLRIAIASYPLISASGGCARRPRPDCIGIRNLRIRRREINLANRIEHVDRRLRACP